MRLLILVNTDYDSHRGVPKRSNLDLLKQSSFRHGHLEQGCGLNSFVNDIFERITLEASKLAKYPNKQTFRVVNRPSTGLTEFSVFMLLQLDKVKETNYDTIV
ncbi:hypothetical protein B0H13DRAFT_2306970 [Mycena leptocephala]|nr:hypothetical protein B0H13DRAFT_2306970 [Mycena leptocephala]